MTTSVTDMTTSVTDMTTSVTDMTTSVTDMTTSVTDVTSNIRQTNVLKQLMTIRIRSEKKGYFMNEFCRPIREDNTIMCSDYGD